MTELGIDFQQGMDPDEEVEEDLDEDTLSMQELLDTSWQYSQDEEDLEHYLDRDQYEELELEAQEEILDENEFNDHDEEVN